MSLLFPYETITKSTLDLIQINDHRKIADKSSFLSLHNEIFIQVKASLSLRTRGNFINFSLDFTSVFLACSCFSFSRNFLGMKLEQIQFIHFDTRPLVIFYPIHLQCFFPSASSGFLSFDENFHLLLFIRTGIDSFSSSLDIR